MSRLMVTPSTSRNGLKRKRLRLKKPLKNGNALRKYQVVKKLLKKQKEKKRWRKIEPVSKNKRKKDWKGIDYSRLRCKKPG
jgi:hypothetical protein